MKTGKFSKLADQFWRLHAIANRQFRIGSVVTYPLWIKCLRLIKNRQYLLAWHILWFSLVELNNAMLDYLFPLRPHRLVSDFCINQGHFWAGMSHPLLHHKQRHAVVHQFHPLGMSECMKLKMNEISCLIAQLILFNQTVQRSGDVFGIQGIPMQEALTVVTIFVLECWKEPALGIFFKSVVLLYPFNLGKNDSCYLFGNRDFVTKHVRFLNVSN